jgi:hypothetical protein
MAKVLTNEHQVFIVQCLARFMSPQETADAVKQEFNFTIKRQSVRHYNPEQSENVAEEWVTLFNETRKAFLEGMEKIGVSHLPYRLQTIQGIIERASRQKNDDLLLRALKQAAEDKGGAFTNKQQQEVSVKGNLVTGTLQEWQAEREKRRQEAESTMAEFGDEEKN